MKHKFLLGVLGFLLFTTGAFAGSTFFRDVHNGHWAFADIEWASEMGLITGNNGNFRPDDAVSRAELAAILHRFANGQAMDEGIEAYVERQTPPPPPENNIKKIEGVSTDDDPILGDENAPVTLIEFSDYECPFCARHFDAVYPQIKENYVDTGKVKIVFRDFPLAFHQNAMSAAVAANCAREQGGDSAYFEMHDLLFSNQSDLNSDSYISFAEEIGLNTTTFESCIDNPEEQEEEIEADMDDGASYGVTGTPAFFINGWFIKGAYPYNEFEKYIEMELE